MDALNLGRLTVTAGADGVSLVLAEEPAQRVSLSDREVGLLQDFLRRHAAGERRLGFRVPFGSLNPEVRAGFDTRLSLRGRWHPVAPVDLSLTGILVQSRTFMLPVRMRVGVALAFAGVECTLTGEVVRRDGQLMALHFLESLSNGNLDPPEPLLAIYGKLEQEWLRSRVH